MRDRPEFRADIEGLRALAVVPILLFHLNAAWCPGGYVGVDIFFVISGYLITRMILAEGGSFSFKQFYFRRFFRLFPALFATLLGALAGGWVLLGPQDFVALAQSALTAAFGISNVHFFWSVDYFNANAYDHPLLHTWSLGVEEQFYLVWPALLVFCARKRLSLPALALGIGALSFAVVLAVRPQLPELVFYMMPFRMMEFAIGAGALIVERRWARLANGTASLFGTAAVAALGTSLVAFDGQTPWPGTLTLLPCLGTAALIAFGPSGLWGQVLAAAPLRFLGRISYSLYLVHWPLITLYRARVVTEPSLGELIALGIGSVGLAWLLYTLVETPFRLTGVRGVSAMPEQETAVTSNWLQRLRTLSVSLPRRIAGPAVALSGAGVIAVSTAVMASNGFPSRLERSRVQLIDKGLTFAGDLCDFKRSRCLFGDRDAQRTVYLVGDSHALNLVFGLDQLFKRERIKGIALYDHGCLFVMDTVRFSGGVLDRKCRQNVADAYGHLASNRHPVVLVGSFAGYRGSLGAEGETAPRRLDEAGYYSWLGERMKTGLASLGAGTRSVILLKSTYVTGVDLAKCLSQPGRGLDALEPGQVCAPWSLSEVKARTAGADRMIEGVAAAFPGVTLLDPKTIFCTTSRCTTHGDDGLYFRDGEHLTNAGSIFLIERAKPALQSVIDGK